LNSLKKARRMASWLMEPPNNSTPNNFFNVIMVQISNLM
jgi:hypothetical protein